MKGQMEATLRVLLVDHIFTLRRLVVALPLFGSVRFAESNAVGLEGFPIRHQNHRVFRFHDDDPVGFASVGVQRRRRTPQPNGAAQQANQQHRTPDVSGFTSHPQTFVALNQRTSYSEVVGEIVFSTWCL